MIDDLVEAIIQSQALRIAPAEEVFLYTSGTVGPYYINTHYLMGGPGPAEEFLTFIDSDKDEIERFPVDLLARIQTAYEDNAGYRAVVDALVGRAKAEMGCIGMVDGVSGGERRDWFFSPAVAHRLGVSHLYIYKDLRTVLHESQGRGGERAEDIDGMRFLHVADLVTEASSYIRGWVPALRDRGAEMAYALNVVDRAQGGMEALADMGVAGGSLLRVDEELFGVLLDRAVIDERQRQALTVYFRDPESAMRTFLTTHPDFLARSLAAEDSRVAHRARLLVDEDPYGLKQSDEG
ncbi:MAG: orotate phosphoribosyltransferase [Gemmatimonadetes bacterium]|nr:orotate phosphoribosyltransferase [Gemmatimonadota bacterium]